MPSEHRWRSVRLGTLICSYALSNSSFSNSIAPGIQTRASRFAWQRNPRNAGSHCLVPVSCGSVGLHAPTLGQHVRPTAPPGLVYRTAEVMGDESMRQRDHGRMSRCAEVEAPTVVKSVGAVSHSSGCHATVSRQSVRGFDLFRSALVWNNET